MVSILELYWAKVNRQEARPIGCLSTVAKQTGMYLLFFILSFSCYVLHCLVSSLMFNAGLVTEKGKVSTAV